MKQRRTNCPATVSPRFPRLREAAPPSGDRDGKSRFPGDPFTGDPFTGDPFTGDPFTGDHSGGAEIPWLVAMQVTPEGSLAGWNKPETQVHSKEFTEGSVLLAAQLLGLLVAFIGDGLTLRLVRDVWPQLSLENLNFITGNQP